MTGNNTYSVSELNDYVSRLFAADDILSYVSVVGEISDLKTSAAGHKYFILKDFDAQISVSFFKGSQRGLKFDIENGQRVVVKGKVTIYSNTGKYQIVASSVSLDGQGELAAEFEAMKKKLAAEGLFDSSHKKPIPKYPKTVGIVTSGTGAAIKDIMSVAKRRDPSVQLILYPSAVQGEGAAENIALGIKTLDMMCLDVIIIGRGGGSMEDLWCFNEEVLARAVYEAQTPIISGTGHDIDYTIGDFVADLRAATPTAAAELAIPDRNETLAKVNGYLLMLQKAQNVRFMGFENRMEVLSRRLDNNSPENKIQRLKHIVETYRSRLGRLTPEIKFAGKAAYLDEIDTRMKNAAHKKKDAADKRFEIILAKLNALSPTAKLVGGYGYIEGKDGDAVRFVDDVKVDDEMKVTLSDGTIRARVTEVCKNND